MTVATHRARRASRGSRRFAAAGLLALGLACVRADAASGGASGLHDNFFWLGQFNKASIVMTTEQGILPPDIAQKTARAVAQVIAEGDKPGGKRPGDYLQLEPLITKIAGADATRMHSGRSRQDILATTRRVMLRDRLLDLYEALNQAHASVNALAEKYADAIVPAYTNGVQAQPTTYGHYLLAFSDVLDRDAARLRQVYARVNLSPMGAAALGTSSFPIDRKRLADLLGFDGVVDNSYDAAQFSQIDIGAEAASLASTMALSVGAFVQDIHTQYHQPKPWLMLTEGKLTGTSSIMPQKRNPYALNDVRLAASETVGDAMAALVVAHNVEPGMPDYKRGQAQDAVDSATDMYLKLDDMLGGLVLNRERALAEVDADYSTTTELADVLQRDANVPFRIGHHFASELVSYGRQNNLKPADIPYTEAQRIYTASGKANGVDNAKLPLDEARFRQVLTAQNMIASSKGQGGPQPAEVARMLADAKQRLSVDMTWVQSTRDRLTTAQDNLDRAFDAVANPPAKK
ncbi:argininosuccinate lyase [Bordetella genomosp. 8]|uniref:argininosuccinate lyase n=1 Tax=Bordetella genomosp. 8 TaxID=1416806 RepID=A0A1W6YKU7_9BORD|nr:argininosuccinate lyase [Bordetella genomosp. 8]ARP81624.1 argininosuccinate lyase [Bordetella genomosp. 8]